MPNGQPTSTIDAGMLLILGFSFLDYFPKAISCLGGLLACAWYGVELHDWWKSRRHLMHNTPNDDKSGPTAP